MKILRIDEAYRITVNAYIKSLWSGPVIVTKGIAYDTSAMPGFVAVEGDALYGAVLYRIDQNGCEVMALFSLVQGSGVGTRLMDAVVCSAKDYAIKRVWLITTNDNTPAIRFYQKYGFAWKATHIGAIEVTRSIKSGIPKNGTDGIPIEHEIEFELILN